jgi:Neutral trehalase
MVKDLVPCVHFYDQDFVDMYNRTWVWLEENWHQGDKDGLFPEGFLTYNGSTIVSLYDYAMSSLFLVYSNQNFSPYSMIDFFYSLQGEDGYIPAAVDYITKEAVTTEENPKGLTLPLLAYVEYNFYHKIGNKKRLKEIVPVLERYFIWICENFQRPNGLFSVPYEACHTGNIPRDGACYEVDFNAAMAVEALYLSAIGDVLNDKELSFRYKRIYFSLKTRISSMMWDSDSRFYYDLDENEVQIRNKHLGAYWTLLAEIPNDETAMYMINHLQNPEEFGTENPFPMLPVSSPYYSEKGDGYRGGVVPFFNYIVIKGLMKYNSFIFARECAIRHLYFILDTLHPDSDKMGDVWEVYRPMQEGPSISDNPSFSNKNHYIAMLGLMTITLIIENIIGLDISLPRKTVNWTMQSLEAMGIEHLSLKKNDITILSNKSAKDWEIRLESEKLYYFTIEILDENRKKTLPIPSGKCSLLIEKL